MEGPDLTTLEQHLVQYSYLHGHQPSQADPRVAGRLMEIPPCPHTHPSVSRWYSHMASFTPEELSRLPQPNQLPFMVPLVRCQHSQTHTHLTIIPYSQSEVVNASVIHLCWIFFLSLTMFVYSACGFLFCICVLTNSNS